MRPPDSTSPSICKIALLSARRSAPALVLPILAVLISTPLTAQNGSPPQTARERMHDSAQWTAIEQHLPDRLTSTPEVLEREGDILRARRFPEDAMDYYNFAFQNGGDAAELLNKLGLAALEMEDVTWARAYFQRVVKLNRKGADGWNNLGTVEYLSGRGAYAVADYSHAVNLDKGRADFHCNLAAAYFEQEDYDNARKEMAAALNLDPQAFERVGSGSGSATQVFSAEDRGRLSFEMARLYARRGAEEQMLHSLAMSSEAGFDVRHGMRRDAALARYANDPRVVVLVNNAQALRTVRATAAGTAAISAVPALATIKPFEGQERARPD
jgi:tetratricopeptide (TPR) repeat protein